LLGKEGRDVKSNILSKLSETQVEQIRLILKVVKGKEHILSSIENIIPLKFLSYLEVTVANQLWEDWQIDQAFNSHKITNSPISTPLMVSAALSPIILRRRIINFSFLQKRLSMAIGIRERLKMLSSILSLS